MEHRAQFKGLKEMPTQTQPNSIFISYAQEDTELAAEIASKLESQGFNVWWDIKIPTGSTFDQVIENRMNQCAVAIVIWTQNSISSAWVRAEAATAHEQGKLVPVIGADCDIPMPFSLIQATNLSKWNGNTTADSWLDLISGIDGVLRRLSTKPTIQSVQKIQPKVNWLGILTSLLLVGLAIGLTAGAVWQLWYLFDL